MQSAAHRLLLVGVVVEEDVVGRDCLHHIVDIVHVVARAVSLEHVRIRLMRGGRRGNVRFLIVSKQIV